MASDFGKGKILFKSKGFDAANAKHKALKKGKQTDGGWIGKNAGGSHAKFHYGKQN